MNNMVIVQKKPNTFGIQIISKHVVWKTIECQLGAILVRLIGKILYWTQYLFAINVCQKRGICMNQVVHYLIQLFRNR